MQYTNPVYPESCPDPFILKFCGEYFCYSTGWAPDGKVFNILHSTDLIHWKSLGGAMEALAGGEPEYWAPEVSYLKGRFYLYYSVGDGVQMRLRAAIASDPAGPFHDAGLLLSDEIFAIDAHVFEDSDGSRYLFYAKDFLEHSHIGTGVVFDRMLDALKLEGKPRPVALPHYDWQVFDPNRIEKGGVRWHTVEGPFVLKYKDRYYQMFSGGNWKNITYGVSYALADSMDTQQEWFQLEHNEAVPLVLATIPGQVIGPGHNSVVRGPDNRQLYCVYHRWASDESARLLSLDRLEWIGDRLSVLGPSTAPQDIPNAPLYPFSQQDSTPRPAENNELIHISTEDISQTDIALASGCFMCEVSTSARPADSGKNVLSRYGLRLYSGNIPVLEVSLHPSDNLAEFRTGEIESVPQGTDTIPLEFPCSDYHLLRLAINAGNAELHIDGRMHRRLQISRDPERLALFSQYVSSSFKGCAITYGFEDNFYGCPADPALLGWQIFSKDPGKWKIFEGEMRQIDNDALNSTLVKVHSFRQYELVINARLIEAQAHDSCYGFYPALTESGEGPLIRIEERGNRPCMAWYSQQDNGTWMLPDDFNRRQAQQFRFIKTNEHLQVYLEADALGSLIVPDRPTRAALYSNTASVSFDMVRLTSLNQAGIERS